MISFNKSQFSLNSLNDAIAEIKNEDSIKKYEFNDLKYELDKIEYEKKIKTQSVLRINEWIESVLYHTFPKTKYRWINTIIAQPNLRNISISYELREIINNSFIKEKIPMYLLEYYNYLYNEYSSNLNIKKSIICKLDAIDIFDYLIDHNILSMKGRRVYINRYILDNESIYNKSFYNKSIYNNIITNKRNRDEDDENNHKRIKYF